MLLGMLEAAEGSIFLLKGELCFLEALVGCGGWLCLPKAFEVLKVAEVMHRVLLCMLEAVEGERCLPEVIRCVLLSTLEVVDGRLCFGVSKFPNCVVRCGSFLSAIFCSYIG